MNDSHQSFSKEPRPVYSREMDVLGFDNRWKYKKQDDAPYMWAESNAYYYRGELVAKTHEGSLYDLPKVEYMTDDEGNAVLPEGKRLQPVDLEMMVEKNRVLMNVLEQITIQKIFNVYKRYRKRLDCFHVAFSGGKDSVVLLDLVKKALPHGSFVVVFGDTGMEFPDTYEVVDKVEVQCEEEGIKFYRAASHLKPEESWKLFGPPSRVLRWCCSVHKSAPQVLKLREVLGKSDYKGMAFVGVRAQESAKRDAQLTQKETKLWNEDERSYIDSYSKVKDQNTAKSIYEWSSAEIWLYTYYKNLVINKAYIKGCSRVGCLCCPMGGNSRADAFQSYYYSENMNNLLQIIIDSNSQKRMSDHEYVATGGWNARKNGKLLDNNSIRYLETSDTKNIIIDVQNPKTDWKEWIKTIGDLSFNTENQYSVLTSNKQFVFNVTPNNNGYIVSISKQIIQDNPQFGKLFRVVFRKAAYCLKCSVCQSNCRFNCISFDKNFTIDNCRHCHNCHDVSAGCLAYDSLKIPHESSVIMKKKLNCFSNHAPKTDWLQDFFEKGNAFFDDNSLAKPQQEKFKAFLRAADLINNEGCTDFSSLVKNLGWDSQIGLGLMLVNLAYNAQIEWYIKNLDVNASYTRPELVDKLLYAEQSQGNINSILYSYKRFCSLPFGTVLNFGNVSKAGSYEYYIRTKCSLSDSRVVLYALYKFAEACNEYFQFSLSRLMDFSVESAGISPAQIFGIDRDEMEQHLNGLSVAYPEFINATFTHDLEKISLRENKTSQDVLELFN